MSRKTLGFVYLLTGILAHPYYFTHETVAGSEADGLASPLQLYPYGDPNGVTPL